MVPYEIVITTGPARGTSYRIEKPTTLIGRSSNADLSLPFDPLISSRHLQIDYDGNRLWLNDVGSTNGTFMNGRKVQRQLLNHTDQALIGSTTLQFNCLGTPPPVIETPPSATETPSSDPKPSAPIAGADADRYSPSIDAERSAAAPVAAPAAAPRANHRASASSPIEGSIDNFEPVNDAVGSDQDREGQFDHSNRRDNRPVEARDYDKSSSSPIESGSSIFNDRRSHSDIEFDDAAFPDSNASKNSNSSIEAVESLEEEPERPGDASTPKTLEYPDEPLSKPTPDKQTPDKPRRDKPTRNENRDSETTGATQIRQVRLKISRGIGDDQPTLQWISPGQVLMVGRAYNCDCSMPHDGNMAEHHFMIECTDRNCKLTDLRTGGGTWLNSKRVEVAELCHHDVIWAGDSEFTIEVETMDGFLTRGSESQGTSDGDRQLQPLPEPSARSSREKQKATSIAATETQLPSGLIALTGKLTANMSLATITDTLSGLGNTYFLVDFGRTRHAFPSDFSVNETKLFAWYPDTSASRSVNLLPESQLSDKSELLISLLGTDGLVVFHSRLEQAQLLAELRSLLFESKQDSSSGDGMLGFCWPSMMNVLLEQANSKFAAALFEHVNCVVTEDSAAADSWRLVCRTDETAQKLLDLWGCSTAAR